MNVGGGMMTVNSGGGGGGSFPSCSHFSSPHLQGSSSSFTSPFHFSSSPSCVPHSHHSPSPLPLSSSSSSSVAAAAVVGGGGGSSSSSSPGAPPPSSFSSSSSSSSFIPITWKPSLDRFLPNEESRDLFLDPTPNILFCGLSKSGKTSISKVVFNKISPHETLYFQSNIIPEVQKIANTNLVKFTLIDVPGGIMIEPFSDEVIFSRAQAIIFVIDAQNEPYTAEIAHAKDLFRRAWEVNANINLEVFIHKVDGDFFAVDEVRAECQRDIHDKLMSHLHEEGVAANVIFYSTSIYDPTIFEACSRVVQRLIPQTPTLEQLLDLLVANCRMEKAFLVDVLSKTFIATDSSPFDPFNYELCTDMVEVVIEMSCMYGETADSETNNNISGNSGSSTTSNITSSSTTLSSSTSISSTTFSTTTSSSVSSSSSSSVPSASSSFTSSLPSSSVSTSSTSSSLNSSSSSSNLSFLSSSAERGESGVGGGDGIDEMNGLLQKTKFVDRGEEEERSSSSGGGGFRGGGGGGGGGNGRKGGGGGEARDDGFR